jgi:hypothetical protein
MTDVLNSRRKRPVSPPRVYLPLRQAVLCLDCEMCYQIEGLACPACGSRAAVTLGRFLVGKMSRDLRPSAAHPSRPGDGPALGRVFLVAAHRFALCDQLRRAFAGDDTVRVLLDRRAGERRKRLVSLGTDRRRGERRAESSIEDQLRMIGWVLVLLDRPWPEPSLPGNSSKGASTAPSEPPPDQVARAKPALERR